MGKYCTDCANEIEQASKQEDMFAFSETVRCKECLGKQDSFGGTSGDFMNPNPPKKDTPPAGTQ